MREWKEMCSWQNEYYRIAKVGTRYRATLTDYMKAFVCELGVYRTLKAAKRACQKHERSLAAAAIEDDTGSWWA